MKMSEMFPSKYLSKDGVTTPVVASIKTITQTELDGDGMKEMKNVLLFNGSIKPMILNKGNAAALCESYGDDTDFWIGKPVEIYVDPSVMFGGKRVGGLRIRVPGQRQAPVQTQLFWTIEQAIHNCSKAGIGKDELIAHLKSKGSNGYSGMRDTKFVEELIASRSAAERPFDEAPPAITEGDANEIPW